MRNAPDLSAEAQLNIKVINSVSQLIVLPLLFLLLLLLFLLVLLLLPLLLQVKDENNQSPVFTDIDSGSVLEHEEAGTEVRKDSS